MNSDQSVKVVFVCMGNICRSPTAHGIFQALVDEQGLGHVIEVDSAGTHSYHVDSPPDLRSQEVALKNGVDLSDLRARQFLSEDFNEFNFILGMDKRNMKDMLAIKPDAYSASLNLMLDFSDRYKQKEVPDPYFRGEGFDLVFDMVKDASAGLLRHIRQQHSI